MLTGGLFTVPGVYDTYIHDTQRTYIIWVCHLGWVVGLVFVSQVARARAACLKYQDDNGTQCAGGVVVLLIQHFARFLLPFWHDLVCAHDILLVVSMRRRSS